MQTTETAGLSPTDLRVQIHESKNDAGCQEVSRCHTANESEESTAHRHENMQASDLPWLWESRQTSQELHNKGISGPTKRNSKSKI